LLRAGYSRRAAVCARADCASLIAVARRLPRRGAGRPLCRRRGCDGAPRPV